MSRLEILRRLTWFFGGLWSIEYGMKPLESGLSSSIAEPFHYSVLNKALQVHPASKTKFLSGWLLAMPTLRVLLPGVGQETRLER